MSETIRQVFSPRRPIDRLKMFLNDLTWNIRRVLS